MGYKDKKPGFCSGDKHAILIFYEEVKPRDPHLIQTIMNWIKRTILET